MCAGSILQTFTDNYSLEKCSIKEPNDVICNGKKIAGVLVDALLQGDKTVAYAGMGVNLNNGLTWNEETLKFATSFRLITGALIDPDEFLVALLVNLDEKYERLNHVHSDAIRPQGRNISIM